MVMFVRRTATVLLVMPPQPPILKLTLICSSSSDVESSSPSPSLESTENQGQHLTIVDIALLAQHLTPKPYQIPGQQ